MSTLISYAVPRSDISEYLDSLFSNHSDINQKSTWPEVDIMEKETAYYLRADLPGVNKNDISIKVENGILEIEGEKNIDHKQEKGYFYHYERYSGKFNRSFVLPQDIDSEKMEARLEHGVLNLTLPKAEKAKPRKIEVKF